MNANFRIRFSSSGVHFFDRKTGMNILIDEFKPSEKLWSAAPRQVSIALTNACDLNCPHCYAYKGSDFLNFDRLKGWLIELDANGCIGIGFGGGEPTLYPNLKQLCQFAAQETKLATSMTTHAHGLSNQLLEDLAGNLNFIRVSMDGAGQTYENIRDRSFIKLINRIAALRRIISFGINFVVNSKTIADLPEALAIAESFGATEFLLLPEVPVGNGTGIDVITMEALKEWVAKYKSNIPLLISEGHTEDLPICDPLKSEKGLAAFAHIDALGILKRTSYDANGVKIFENGIMEAFNELKNNERAPQ